ncbi:MAG: hypothetical protein KDA72_06245 [Planctomycetales bacterium]|nr:hypothetical protein [Planctomycetales bacterium]
MMTRESNQTGDLSDGEQLIARMNAIRNSSQRHVERMQVEAGRLVDWREHVRAQPLLAVAVASAAGFLLVFRRTTPAPSTPQQLASKQVESGEAARTSLASGAMAFAGTMLGNLLKQTLSNYVKNQLAGGQHDRSQNERTESTAGGAAQSPSRW